MTGSLANARVHRASASMSVMTYSMNGMKDLLTRLWPLHRTINSDDMEEALRLCGGYLDDDRFTIHRYVPGTDAFTWKIPERYRVEEAWLTIRGERVADFHANPLHLLSYSLPKTVKGVLRDIREHIYSRPERPEAIPWEFKYYERDWGFCLRHEDLIRFQDSDPVEGVIRAEFTQEDFCLGDLYLPGESDTDLLFLTNVCHPCQVNDSLAGLVVGLEMARRVAALDKRRHGFRLLVVPETIGTMAWFSNHLKEARRIRYAWFCEMVGHDQSFILQHSRQGDALIDQVLLLALSCHRRHGRERTGPFREIVASDEIVTNGPGFDIPTPSLTRWPYPEYHTSDDNPSIITEENLEEALEVFMEVWDILETNYYPRRRFMGPVMLSRYGLWVDWRVDRDLNLQTERIMFMLEGDLSIAEIAHRLSLPMNTVRAYVDRFHDAGLVETSRRPWDEPAPGFEDGR